MSYSIRSITNGITIGTSTGPNGSREEFAFLFENEDWRVDAKAHVDAKKQDVIDVYAQMAHDRIDNIDPEAPVED